MSIGHRIMGIAFAGVVAGCASTDPQLALDHANHGVALVAQLQRQLSDFDAHQLAIARLRERALTDQVNLAQTYASDNTLSDHIAAKSGDADRIAFRKTVREIVDQRSRNAIGALTREATTADLLDALMASVSVRDAGLTATQKALAELGTGMSSADRFKLIASFIQEVSEEIEKNKEAALTATSSASAPSN